MDGRSLLSMPRYVSKEDALRGDRRALFVEVAKDRAVITQGFKYIASELEPLGDANNGNEKMSCRHDNKVAGRMEAMYPAAKQTKQLYDLVLDPSEQTNIATSAGLQMC